MTTHECPPDTWRNEVIDTLHGVDIADPYRWLEDGDDPHVIAWVAEQNRATRDIIDAIPARADWHRRLVEFMTLPIVQAVQVRGERLILLERGAGQQQARLVVRPVDDPGADVVVLADPAAATGAAADAAVAIDWFFASTDGDLIAYGISEGGTESSVLHVVRADGSHLDDVIPNCRAASVAWEPDGSGFYYTRYPDGDEYHRTVHHHRLGDDPVADPVIWETAPNPQAWPEVALSPDGRHLLVDVMVGWSRSDEHLLDRSTGQWSTIIEGQEATTDLVFSDEHTLLGVTMLDAPRGRIVSIDLEHVPADPSGWTVVVPERDVVVGVPKVVGGSFLVPTSRAGVDSVELWSLDGSSCHDVEGIGVSTVAQLATDRTAGTALALIVGFDSPAAVWTVDTASTDVGGGAGPSVRPLWPDVTTDVVPDLTVSHVEYPSTDGTMIGLFLVEAAGADPMAPAPTILNGYGGFGITESPVWSATIAAWCAAGGRYAIAGLRGGLEHGEEWHDAGRRAQKQNVFDDFHAAADWLVETGRCGRDDLAIAGGSNGGLLVGAALTQRPDLCRAVWCAVPLLDMVRFPQFLIAKLWTDEYGDPDVAEEFAWLHAYSPYHHVSEGQSYPAVLFTTAEGDTRVDPLHARKMAALVQWAAPDQDERPVLLHQEGRAGHGVGKPVGKRADEQADVLAFFSSQLGLQP